MVYCLYKNDGQSVVTDGPGGFFVVWFLEICIHCSPLGPGIGGGCGRLTDAGCRYRGIGNDATMMGRQALRSFFVYSCGLRDNFDNGKCGRGMDDGL